MNRRSFIGSILALGCAPAIVRADSLMRIVPRGMLIIILSADDLEFIKQIDVALEDIARYFHVPPALLPPPLTLYAPYVRTAR